MITAKF